MERPRNIKEFFAKYPRNSPYWDGIASDGLKRKISIGDKFRHKITHKLYDLKSFGLKSKEWHLVCKEDGVEFKLGGRKEVARLFEDPRLESQRPQDWISDGI